MVYSGRILYPLSTVPCAAVSGDCCQRGKELNTINSPQTLIATFVYLSFLSVLTLHPSLHPSPMFSRSLSLSPSSTDQLLSSPPPSTTSPAHRGPAKPTPPLTVPQVNQRHLGHTLARKGPGSPYGLAEKAPF